ncbi:MAG: hypothetical protein GX621_16615, partial [Pirellulaceae bacterium]|nr:hypothetical protein [Pirellulaceae bacterium]
MGGFLHVRSLAIRRVGVLSLLLLLSAAMLRAADEASPPAQTPPSLPAIADEPKTIDPAALMPAKLAARATVNFTDSSLREVIDWLRAECKLVVLLDEAALSEIDLAPSEPVSDRLDNAPVYLLLNRLRSLGLAWDFEDDILHITSAEQAEGRRVTVPHNVGDLLDAGYDQGNLIDVIMNTLDYGTWVEYGGEGTADILGDVLFVRQTDELQRKVQGLLAALRRHGRQTFVLDPTEHLALRQKLEENVNVAFVDTPLETAVRKLAEDAGVDLRLDRPALRELRIREREPITLKLADRKLRTVLQALTANLKLTWILRDGVLWITSPETAEAHRKTAVFDVRDLCRDDDESSALADALTTNTSPGRWQEYGGEGLLELAKPGTLVVYNQESVLMEVLDLLETYRAALRASRPRAREVVDPKEVITVYYRLHENVATDLATLLPQLVRPDSWKSHVGPDRPDAPGEIT